MQFNPLGGDKGRGALELGGTAYDPTSDTIHILKAGDSITDGANFAVGSTTGTKIGTAATQKLGFYGVTPIVRPGPWTLSGVVTNHTFNAGAPSTSTLASALGTLIQDLQNLGIIG